MRSAKLELFARIAGITVWRRVLAERCHVHRHTVRQALASAEPPPRKPRTPSASILDPFKPVIDAMLREEGERPGALFRPHYRSDAFYSESGIDGAHEKGGVEGEVGRFRRTWLTPVPRFGSWAQLNDYLRACEEKDDNRRITWRLATIGRSWVDERP